MTAHLCLSCRHAKWDSKNCRLTGRGFCQAPDPELPILPAVKWWNFTMMGKVRGGDIKRANEFPVMKCDFHQEGVP